MDIVPTIDKKILEDNLNNRNRDNVIDKDNQDMTL